MESSFVQAPGIHCIMYSYSRCQMEGPGGGSKPLRQKIHTHRAEHLQSPLKITANKIFRGKKCRLNPLMITMKGIRSTGAGQLCALLLLFMVFILDGSSFHVAHV